MRFALLLCALTATVVQAQQSATSSSSSAASSSSSAPEDNVPTVVKLASQKVTIPPAQIPLKTLDGKDVLLGDYDAKVVVVSLWGTISNDNEFLKTQESLRKSFAGKKDVVILAVNVDMPKNEDDLNVIRDIAKEAGVTYPMLIDKELKLLAFVNQRLRPNDLERNTFLMPHYLLFSQRFEKLDKIDFSSAKTEEEFVKVLRKEVERARLRK